MTRLAKQLYQSAARTSIGRAFLYRWRYWGFRFRGRHTESPNADRLVATLSSADFETACKLAVKSWYPSDTLNETLYRELLLNVTLDRPDLGVTPEVVDCLVRVMSSTGTLNCVDRLVAENYSFGAINSALHIALLGDLPKSERRLRIGELHPREMLAAITSTARYVRRKKRRVILTDHDLR